MKKKFFLLLTTICFVTIQFVIGLPFISYAISKEPIKFGFITALSGLFMGAGEPQSKGALLAAKIINEEGGILGHPAEILLRDDEVRPAIGIRMARELHKEQGVNFFLGMTSSGVALALKSVMEEQNTLLITCAAHSTAITGKQFSRNVFRITDDARTRSYALAQLLHEKFPNMNKWANISPDYEYGHSCGDNFSEKLKQLNPQVKIVADRWPRFGAGGGYGPHITAILQAEPEGLHSVLYGGDLIAFIREAKQWGLFDKIKVFATSHLAGDVPYTLKKEMVPTWGAEHYLDLAYNYPLSRKFGARFKEIYGKDYFIYGQGHAAPGFDAVYAYKAAIEKAKSLDVNAVRKPLEDLTIDSPLGKKWIRAGDHQAYFDMPYFQIVPDPKEELGWKVESIRLMRGQDFMVPVEEALKR